MIMINKLSRNLFYEVIGVPTKRRALSFAIMMKNLKPTSVVKDWSYRLLARESGLAPGTCKKYIGLLQEMELVSIRSYHGHKYLTFKKLKEAKKKNKRNRRYHTARRRDISLGKYDTTSIKIIEKHLAALYIWEIQSHKDYCRQSISTKQNPKNPHEYKRALKICRTRGWDNIDRFDDNGISFKYLCKSLHASPNTVSAIISYGESINLFTVKRSSRMPAFYGPGNARQAAKYMDEPHSWSTDDTVFYQQPNRFVINPR